MLQDFVRWKAGGGDHVLSGITRRGIGGTG
jgi:hypothetical protein